MPHLPDLPYLTEPCGNLPRRTVPYLPYLTGRHPNGPVVARPNLPYRTTPCATETSRTTPFQACLTLPNRAGPEQATPAPAKPALLDAELLADILVVVAAYDLKRAEATASTALRIWPAFAQTHLPTHAGDQVVHILRVELVSIKPDT